MKTLIKTTTVIAGLIISANVNAQSLNISGGVSNSKLIFDGISTGSSTENYNGTTYTTNLSYKAATNATFGLSYEFNLGNRLSLETGGRFMSRGFTETYTREIRGPQYVANAMERTSYKLNYIDIPLILNTAITTGDLRTYVRTGIYAGFMVSSKYSTYWEESDSDGYSSTYEYSDTDMGMDTEERITGGIQLGLGASYKQFYFETNYSFGHFTLSDFDSGITTRDLSFTLGYKINFKKK